ncbi:Fms-Related Tyrosine Kinase 3 Ligand [Manis pentadactyla]|nr:Fms-Related Tyrosine Kinase 3 Ligand [Manis pentadactyla]
MVSGKPARRLLPKWLNGWLIGFFPATLTDRNATGEEICGGSWRFRSPAWKWHSFYWLLLYFPYLLWLPSTLPQMRGMKLIWQ